MNIVGDLLILFDAQVYPPSGRLQSSTWKLLSEFSPVWVQRTSPAWKGFPFRSCSSPDWEVRVLGEFQLQMPANGDGEPAELTRSVASQFGSFLIFAWHRNRKEWHVWTDRFGTLHAYYAWDGRRAALSTFAPAVAAVASRRALDWEALAAWFSFGFFPADRTHFTDVRILRPASHYVFDEQGCLLREERYWDWQYNPDEKRNYPDTVEEFGRVFAEVMTDALSDGCVAVPVSGGLDSRSTVAAVDPELSQTGRLWAYSYGYGNASVETTIACQVAQARSLPFQAYTIQPYLFEQIERLLAYTEGFQDVTQARQMAVRDEIGLHADILIAALWGDVWLDEMGLAGQPDASEQMIGKHALKKIRKNDTWLLANLVLPKLRIDSAEPMLAEFVQVELQRLSDLGPPDFLLKAFKTEQWSFRWSIPPTRVFQSAAWPRKVFYDTRLADFFCTVPVRFLRGRQLQIDYLKRFAPDLARITWQAYDADLYHYQEFNTWQLPKRAVKKAWRSFRGDRAIQRNWEVQFLHLKGRPGLERWLIQTGLKLHEFISVAPLKALIEDFYREPLPARAYPLSMLLTFSAWLEMYG